MFYWWLVIETSRSSTVDGFFENWKKQETYFFNNDHKYKGLGFEYYLNLYSFPKENVLNYEKTPTYYKSIRAQSRIQAMNSTIKLVNIGKPAFILKFNNIIWLQISVCDNVRRTLSRFLHIQHGVATKKFTPVKLKGLGHTLETFNDNLRKTIKSFGAFLEEIKKTEGGGNMEGKQTGFYVIDFTLNIRFG